MTTDDPTTGDILPNALTPDRFAATAAVLAVTAAKLTELGEDPATWDLELVRAELDVIKHSADYLWWRVHILPTPNESDVT